MGFEKLENEDLRLKETPCDTLYTMNLIIIHLHWTYRFLSSPVNVIPLYFKLFFEYILLPPPPPPSFLLLLYLVYSCSRVWLALSSLVLFPQVSNYQAWMLSLNLFYTSLVTFANGVNASNLNFVSSEFVCSDNVPYICSSPVPRFD